MRDIGAMQVGVLRDASLAERAATTGANFLPLGTIDYRAPNWLLETSGIYAVKLTDEQLRSALSAPLALVAEQPAGTTLVAIRETAGGE